MLRTKLSRVASVMTAAGCLLLGANGAYAHAKLDHATPAADSTVAASPDKATLSFTEKLEPKFSTVEVRNAAGARVDQGKANFDGTTMSIPLKPSLPAGSYSVRWRVLSVDGHKTNGSFSFRVGQ